MTGRGFGLEREREREREREQWRHRENYVFRSLRVLYFARFY
jgi:hypothetical protein